MSFAHVRTKISEVWSKVGYRGTNLRPNERVTSQSLCGNSNAVWILLGRMKTTKTATMMMMTMMTTMMVMMMMRTVMMLTMTMMRRWQKEWPLGRLVATSG